MSSPAPRASLDEVERVVVGIDTHQHYTLKGRGGDGTSGGMDDLIRRVGAVEADVKEIKADLKRIDQTTSRTDGRVSQMPTSFQLLGMVVAIVMAVMGATFAMIRFALPG